MLVKFSKVNKSVDCTLNRSRSATETNQLALFHVFVQRRLVMIFIHFGLRGRGHSACDILLCHVTYFKFNTR